VRGWAAAGAAAVALAVAGCGGGHAAPTRTVQQTTRVEVVRAAGAAQGFDPAGIYRRESPGVVTILATGFQNARGGGGLGSGFVIDGDGEIATNAHVVTTGEGRSIRPAGELYVRFGDGNQVAAHLVGFDPFSDVALIRVEPGGLTLHPLALGSTEGVQVGAPVAAIGSPFGEERSLSVGVISATGRSIQSLTGFQTSGALQTDAAINSGNSGGPLLDARGRVLGINSQIRTTSGEGSGVGFAVPVDVVRRSLGQLRETGHVRYAYLGVSTGIVYPQLGEHFHLGTDHGAWIQDVVAGGPAAQAGLRPGGDRETFQDAPWRTGGDVITRIDGRDIRDDADVSAALLAHQPGDTVAIEVRRDGRARTVRAKLGTRPLQSPEG